MTQSVQKATGSFRRRIQILASGPTLYFEALQDSSVFTKITTGVSKRITLQLESHNFKTG